MRAQVPLLLCAVVVGNSYPVSESPQDADGGFNGKPIRAKADSHITVVAKASADALPLPLSPDKWDCSEKVGLFSARVFTELVVRDESQVRGSPRAQRSLYANVLHIIKYLYLVWTFLSVAVIPAARAGAPARLRGAAPLRGGGCDALCGLR